MKKKDISNKNISIDSQLNTEEVEILEKIYKKNFTGYKSISIKGIFNYKTLSRGKAGSTEYSYIDNHEINNFLKYPYIENSEYKIIGIYKPETKLSREIIYPAIIENFSENIKQNFSNKRNLIKEFQKINSLESFRNLSANEKSFADHSCLIFTLIIISIFFTIKSVVSKNSDLLLSSLFFTIIFFTILISKKIFSKIEVYKLEGAIQKNPKIKNIIYIDEVRIHVKDDWISHYENGEILKVESIKNKGVSPELTAISLGNHNISEDLKNFEPLVFFTLIILLIIYCFCIYFSLFEIKIHYKSALTICYSIIIIYLLFFLFREIIKLKKGVK